MSEAFADILAIGGKSNSLGRTSEVIAAVLDDRVRLKELYACLFSSDPWIRMRAADALEKICRERPDWLLTLVDKFISDLHTSKQPSIQWHLAQIYRQTSLTAAQEQIIIKWLIRLVSTKEVDWIVSANAMDTLEHFRKAGRISSSDLIPLLQIQAHHKSTAVVKRAMKILDGLGPNLDNE